MRFRSVGGVRPGIAGELQGSGCIVRYTTTERADAIVTHYGESLSAAGWLLTGIRPGRDQASGDLYAERGRLSLWLSWFPAGGASTRVIVSLHD